LPEVAVFDELVESQPRRVRSMPQALASIVTHTVVIAVSIQLTRAVAHDVAKPIPQQEMLLTRAPAPPVAPAPVSPSRSAVAAPAAPVLPAAPITVPTAIPPVAVGPAIDLRRLGFDRVPAGPPAASRGDSGAVLDGVITRAMADVPAEYLDGPAPVYPPALRQVGVTGTVTLQSVVDADGKVEPVSVKVVDSSNPGFNAAAIRAILAARFRPAQLRGRTVRQLVQQVVRFTLAP
jgi:periplasmic protein TonB